MPEPRQAGAQASEPQVGPIPHSQPAVGAAEIDAVQASLESGWLAQGPGVARLESEAGGHLGLPDHSAVALSSGTAALYAALRALHVGDGKEVLIPAYACASLHQAVRYTGATPRFVDCDPATLNPDPDDARAKLSAETAACIVPHLFGLPADIQGFLDLGPPVIEDCAQTLGVHLDDQLVGNYGALTVCSFYATKLVAGGEGGMVLSRDADGLAVVAELRDCEAPGGHPDAFNFKMTDLHAAVARVQLTRLPEFLSRRRELAARYTAELDRMPLRLPAEPRDREHAWFRYVVMVEAVNLDALLERCARHGVICGRPVGRLIAEVEDSLDDLPGCRQAWQQACSIPLYPALTDERAALVMDRFSSALEESCES